jgi:hypothetical protein
MVIFNGYVKLPEGNMPISKTRPSQSIPPEKCDCICTWRTIWPEHSIPAIFREESRHRKSRPGSDSTLRNHDARETQRAIYLQKKPITPSHVSLIDCNIMCLKKYLRKFTDATSRYHLYIQLYTMAHRWLHQWQQTLRHQTRKNLGRCRAAVYGCMGWSKRSPGIYMDLPMESYGNW